jgi:hypothetical protein
LHILFSKTLIFKNPLLWRGQGEALYDFGYGLIVFLAVLSSAADFALYRFVLSPFL